MTIELSFTRNSGDQSCLIAGWSNPEETIVWSCGTSSILRLPRPHGASVISLTLNLRPFLSGTNSFQAVKIYILHSGLWKKVSNIVLRKQEVTEIYARLEEGSGLDSFELRFSYDCPARPCDVSDSTDQRLLGVALAGIKIREITITPPYRLSNNLLQSTPDAAKALRLIREADVGDANRFSDPTNAQVLLKSLLEAYLRNIGSTMHVRKRMRDRIAARVQRELDCQDHVFSTKGVINTRFINDHFPELNYLAFKQADGSDVTSHDLWEKYDNDLRDIDFPVTYGHAFTEATRPSFSIHHAAHASIFVDAYSFVILGPSDREYFTAYRQVVSQDLSTRCLSSQKSEVDGTIVILQDQFDCGNFAHFLYDSITRMIHFCSKFPDLKSNAMFIFGGWPSKFHHMILSRAIDLCGIEHRQCLFPGHGTIFKPTYGVFWFSDQEWYHHPAQRMHTKSATALRSLSGYLGSPQLSENRIYISRSDAAFRRINNEDQLITALELVGFKSVRMSELSYAKQIELVSSASCIVAPHGMGLTPIAFHTGCPTIIEIFNPMIGSDAYAWVSRGLGFVHKPVVGREIDDRSRDYVVDISEVMDALKSAPIG